MEWEIIYSLSLPIFLVSNGVSHPIKGPIMEVKLSKQQKVIRRSDSRGIAEHGWLHSRHTFSFSDYYTPNRVGFGKLRVLNDDIVEPGMGFDTHPYDNMEIVSIPLSGTLRHKDSVGNQHIISSSEI